MGMRQLREAKALTLLRNRKLASALEIGAAAVRGELRAYKMPNRAKEAIGLNIAIELVRRKVATPTIDNRFSIMLPTGSAASERIRIALS